MAELDPHIDNLLDKVWECRPEEEIIEMAVKVGEVAAKNAYPLIAIDVKVKTNE